MVGGSSDALGVRRMVRRYAVPEWMIAECAEARERGDWRAACEAARVTVDIDDAGPVADLLAGFAPDLLRWHLPRSGSGTAGLSAGLTYLLAPDGPVTPDSTVLVVRSPEWVTGSQRLTVQARRAGDLREDPVYPLAPYLWDARRVGELRDVLQPAEPPVLAAPAEPPPSVPCGRCGKVRTDEPSGPPGEWAAAGWVIDESATLGYWGSWDLAVLGKADPSFAVRELRRLTAQFGHRSYRLRGDEGRLKRYYQRKVYLEAAGDRHRMTCGEPPPPRPGSIGVDLCLHPMLLRPPVDLELIRHDLIGILDLHPLVRAALFPATGAETRPAAGTSMVPAGFWQEERFRVRCGRQWHWISLRDGQVELLHHDGAERRREHALRAFGGAMRGCFQAELGWLDGDDAAPKRLREHRHDLWRRMEHGGSRVVRALLDAGMNPHVRDGQGRTLLHRMYMFEHEELLPRLLATGLDVNALSRRGWTAMAEALVHSAPMDLLVALNAAGAYPQLSLTDPEHWPDRAG
ncbi:ankyrin repeat domain-containing protein [Catellatospora aurea]|uniref:Ankyrin repeat domain-containing protein n=1 Tax=Catellatospora aurea TaxID=1337874 RepID=A0ABW2GU40_9ACTN